MMTEQTLNIALGELKFALDAQLTRSIQLAIELTNVRAELATQTLALDAVKTEIASLRTEDALDAVASTE